MFEREKTKEIMVVHLVNLLLLAAPITILMIMRSTSNSHEPEEDEASAFVGNNVSVIRNVPRYLQFLHQQYSSLNPQTKMKPLVDANASFVVPRKTIFVAWSPINFTGNAESTEIFFQQELSQEQYGEISSAQMTLVVRQNLSSENILNGTFASVTGYGGEDNEVEKMELTQPIYRNSSFYLYEFTEVIKGRLMPELLEPNYIGFKVSVFQKKENESNSHYIDFNEIFEANETTITIFL